MTFIALNQNFINIKLRFEMKGLSNEDKFKKYFELRSDIINRLKNSRINSNDLSQLYIEAFDIIGNYDADLLWLNIFYEESFVKILDTLLKNNIFSKEYPISNNSIGHYLKLTLSDKHFFNNEDLDHFLRDFLIDKIGISHNDWIDDKENSNPIIHHFGDYLINSFKNEYKQEINLVFIVFVKVWNTLQNFSSPFNNTKAILLYGAFNNAFKGNDLININYDTFISFEKEIKNCFNSLIFNYNKIFIPFLDSSICNGYKSGYLTQREKYFQIRKRIEELCCVSIEDDYLTLITRINQIKEREIAEKYRCVINKKLEAYEYPSLDEIEKIRKIEVSNNYFDVHTDFFNKIYLY